MSEVDPTGYDADQAAEILKAAPSWLTRMAQAKQIPHRHYGRGVIFTMEDLREIASVHRVGGLTREEMERSAAAAEEAEYMRKHFPRIGKRADRRRGRGEAQDANAPGAVSQGPAE